MSFSDGMIIIVFTILVKIGSAEKSVIFVHFSIIIKKTGIVDAIVSWWNVLWPLFPERIQHFRPALGLIDEVIFFL